MFKKVLLFKWQVSSVFNLNYQNTIPNDICTLVLTISVGSRCNLEVQQRSLNQDKLNVYLFEDQFHAGLQLIFGVDWQVFELSDQDFEFLRAKLVQDAANLPQ